MHHVYILKCQNGMLYTGMTSDIKRRMKEHKNGGCHFTSYNPPIELIYTESFTDKHQAAQREKQIKRWTRAKKQALADGDLDRLKRL